MHGEDATQRPHIPPLLSGSSLCTAATHVNRSCSVFMHDYPMILYVEVRIFSAESPEIALFRALPCPATTRQPQTPAQNAHRSRPPENTAHSCILHVSVRAPAKRAGVPFPAGPFRSVRVVSKCRLHGKPTRRLKPCRGCRRTAPRSGRQTAPRRPSWIRSST